MNAVERALVFSRSEYIDVEDLPLALQEGGEWEKQDHVSQGDVPSDLPLEEVERATILKTLKSSGGNKSEAARRLGITRKTLHKKLKKYGVMD
jgi:two-component system response regulator HydG